MSKSVGFLLLGGAHHILHLIPPAAELAASNTVTPLVFVTTDEEAAQCRKILSALGADRVEIKVLKTPAWCKWISPKLTTLLFNSKIIRGVDALVVAERTSTIINKLPGKMPICIHIPHGAGDRAKSYDKRIRHFDHVIVPGPKDKTRMIDLNLVTETNCHVSGYIKAHALDQLKPEREALFNNDNPVVLYNPHFELSLSSWSQHGLSLLQAFMKMPDFNFVIAPHIRLFANASDEARRKIEAYNMHSNILVDLGSEASTDMTYTYGADIYLGDVSSQVYEFLILPGPCIFLGADSVEWRENPDYAHWHYGRVCGAVDEVVAAINSAHVDHAQYHAAQLKGRDAALGDPNWNPMERSAEIIELAARGEQQISAS